MKTQYSLFWHAAILGMLYFMVLPYIPNRGIGPYQAINPHAVVKLSLVILVITYAGHLLAASAQRHHAFLLSGFLGGFTSSTATVLAMAHLSKEEPNMVQHAASAAVASNIATYLQMAVLVALMSTELFTALALPLLGGVCSAAVLTRIMHQKANGSHAFAIGDMNWLATIKKTMLIVSLLSVMMVFISITQHFLGHQGVNYAAFFSGLVDGHASAISISELVASGKMPVNMAVLPVLIGLSSNTLIRALLSAVSGSRRFTVRVSGSLLGAVAMTWLVFFALHYR